MTNNKDNSNNNTSTNEKSKDKSVHPMLDPTACKELKERHDQCFYKWYSSAFLKGSSTNECQEEWEEYQVCIKDKLRAWNLEHLLDKDKK